MLAADVVAADHRGQRFELRQRVAAGVGTGSCCRKIEFDARSLFGDGFVADLVDAQERCAGIDLGVDGSEDLTHLARVRSANRSLHFHGFQHDQGGAGFDVVADRDRYCDDDGGSGRTDHAGVVLADLVADAVDLDEIARRAHDGNDVEAPITDHQTRLEVTETIDVDLDVAGVSVDAVAVWADTPDGQLVCLTLIVELDGTADRVIGAGRPPRAEARKAARSRDSSAS